MSTRRTTHTLEIADHLWDAIEAMALEMDADPRALVNQALFNFARVNGYFVPGTVARVTLDRGAQPPPPVMAPPVAAARAEAAPPVAVLAPPVTPPFATATPPDSPASSPAAAPPARAPVVAPAATAPGPGGPPASAPGLRPDVTMPPQPAYVPKPRPEKPADPDAEPGRVAQARRIAEIHADLELLTVPVPDRQLVTEDEDEDEDEEASEENGDEEDGGEAEAAAQADDAQDEDDEETAAVDEREPATEDRVPVQDDEEAPDHRDERTLIGVSLSRKLFVTVEDDEPVEVTGARFIIGRDAKCDLVVPSDKLSRQHAAVVLDATGAELEDLGSSNGTWYDEERIDKRDIDDGDEFMLGNVRLRFEFRG